MKRRLVWVIVFFIGMVASYAAYGSCPTSHPIQSSGSITNCGCSPTVFPDFWCLSQGSSCNNGTYFTWLQCDTSTCWFDGNWSSSGINGCCGMWDAGGCQSKTMMATVHQNRNEGTATHGGEYNADVAEKPAASTGFLFWLGMPMAPIPTFRIGTYISGGTGGVTTITLAGWGSPSGPANYWVTLQNGTHAPNLALGNNCSPGGTSPCPAPIAGYQIRAITAGCADGTCVVPTPAHPTTSLASAWNLPVGGTSINTRTPTFPIPGITITNPATCTPLNRYIYIATQMRYADGYISTYVSANSGVGTLADPIDWCIPLADVPGEAATSTPMQCGKLGASFTCSYSNGGTCTSDNTIYYGSLANVGSYQYQNSICYLGTTGTTAFSLPDGNWFWVLVSNNGTKEGSYGKNSSGIERPEAVSIGSCDYAQDFSHTCPALTIKKRM
jgi:hypothetical protein